MRKALALAAFLAMAPYAQAQEDANGTFSTNAEYRLRWQYDQNVTGNKDVEPTSQDAFKQRMKVGGMYKASDKLSAKITLLHNAGWGIADSNNGDTKAQLNGVGDGQNLLLVNEAYASWMVSDEFTLRAGRGSLGFGDGTVIAENDWQATPYSFEGLLGTYEMEFGRVSGFFVRFADYTNTTAQNSSSQDPEANSVGVLYAHKMLPEFMNRADVHVLKNTKSYTAAGGTSTTATEWGQDILRYGVSLGGDVAMIDWRAVYNAHSGDYIASGNGTAVSKVKSEANMMELELGANFEEFMKSRFYVLYHQDSGDDGSDATKNKTYDPYFYELHANAGLMDVVKWGNLTQLSVGYTMSPMDSTMVGLHYHMFSRTEARGAINAGLNGTSMTSGVSTAATAKDKIGDEIDLVATHDYENGFMMTGRLGMFMPGDALKDANNTTKHSDTYTTVFVEAKMNF